eukprot:1160896-Pelagomonas_calceolata.AAC.3
MRSIIVFNSTPSGNKLVGINNRMGMKFASKFNGMLVVQSQSFKLIKGMLNVTAPTDTQRVICMLLLCGFQLLGRPCVFTVLGFNRVYVPLVHTQLMRLSNAGGRRRRIGFGMVRGNQDSTRTAGGESRSRRKPTRKGRVPVRHCKMVRFMDVDIQDILGRKVILRLSAGAVDVPAVCFPPWLTKKYEKMDFR